MAALVLLLNAPQYTRNFEATGSPLGTSFAPAGNRVKYSNDTISMKGIAANCLRYATLHLATPSQRVNHLLESATQRAIRLIGADPNDPATTWRGEFFIVRTYNREEIAGNLLHF